MLSIGIRHLRYVLAVADKGGVTAAAEFLNISQPAISVAIVKVEEQLGKPLFIRRKGSTVVVTSFGRDFVSSASRLLLQFDKLLAADGETSIQGQSVVIGCFEDLAPLIIGAILAKTQARYPDADIAIRTGDFDFLTAEMLAGRIDFAITFDLGLDTSFETRALVYIRPHALLSPDHALAGKPKISLQEIAAHPVVLVDQEQSLWHMIALFRERGLSLDLTYRTETFEMMRSIVSNSLGIGISYTRARSNVSYDGKPIVIRPITDELKPEPIVIASNRHNPLSDFAIRLATEIPEMANFESVA